MDERKMTRQHWTMILVCCGLVATCIGLCYNSYGMYYTPLCERLGVGRAKVAVHATIFSLVVGFVNPLVFKLLKRVHIRVITSAGAVLTALTFIWMGYVRSVIELGLIGVIRGIGVSCIYLPIVTVLLGNWFSRGRGLITSIVMSFSGIAGVIFSSCLAALIGTVGFTRSCYICSLFVALMTLPGCLFFIELMPKDKGLRPADISRGATDSRATLPEERTEYHELRTASAMFLMLILLAAIFSAITGFTAHFAGMAEWLGMGTMFGATMVSAIMVGNILSKLIAGVLVERFGIYRSLYMIIGVATVGLFLIMVGQKMPALLLIGAALYGSSNSLGPVGFSLLSRQLYGNEKYGPVYSLVCLSISISYAVSLVAIGAAFDRSGNYTGILLCGLILALVGAVIVLIESRLDRKEELIIEEDESV